MLSQVLKWPQSLQASHRLTKKSFYEHGQLSSSAQKLLQNEVETIHIRGHMTPDNSNMPAFQNDQQEYLELFAIEINLKNHQAWSELTNKQITTLHELVHKAIAYPLILEIRSGDRVQWSLAEKATHQSDADYDKLIIHELMQTDWIHCQQPQALETDFFKALAFDRLSRQNLYRFYQSLMQAFIAFLIARQTGRSELAALPENQDNAHTSQATLNAQRQTLKRIGQLIREVEQLKTKIKGCDQFNEKVELNLQLQTRNQELEALKTGYYER